MLAPLTLIAQHGKLVLILGLIAGVALPDVALAMRPWIGMMVAGLLFLAALRVGPRDAVGALGDVGLSLSLVALFQLALPTAAILMFGAMGGTGWPVAIFLVLMLAASPVSGSPNLTIMCGGDPAPALRQLVVGTALLPFTVIPVFWLTPAFGDPRAVLGAAGSLMLLIAGAAGLAFLIRGWLLPRPSDEVLRAVDGAAALAMGVVVIGLMSAVGPELRADPMRVLLVLGLVSAVNFFLQATSAVAALAVSDRAPATAIGIVAGNRNIALFLTVLPSEIVDPLLLLIGCYQIPMYVTPAVMGRFYTRSRRSLGSR
ncbi:hypothetical protein GA830_16750 [Mesorhizobium sp. NBSH29]|uniref:hypothetical protein n=1 Tax=Mesorhizobium sp. NBSH29 TaxID=2654249 RepID=UPI0018969C05|nr:hypothetical protein [Mesorhizobium sp. NBSH29]QPC88218.1 hypothetical protein GA830_16750 [Mesorhizobium sp. NBSH29]